MAGHLSGHDHQSDPMPLFVLCPVALQWELYVAPRKGWESNWLGPAIFGVVMFSLLASVQMFWALLSRWVAGR